MDELAACQGRYTWQSSLSGIESQAKVTTLGDHINPTCKYTKPQEQVLDVACNGPQGALHGCKAQKSRSIFQCFGFLRSEDQRSY